MEKNLYFYLLVIFIFLDPGETSTKKIKSKPEADSQILEECHVCCEPYEGSHWCIMCKKGFILGAVLEKRQTKVIEKEYYAISVTIIKKQVSKDGFMHVK